MWNENGVMKMKMTKEKERNNESNVIIINGNERKIMKRKKECE